MHSAESYDELKVEFEVLNLKYRRIAKLENLKFKYSDLQQVTGLVELENFVVWKYFLK